MSDVTAAQRLYQVDVSRAFSLVPRFLSLPLPLCLSISPPPRPSLVRVAVVGSLRRRRRRRRRSKTVRCRKNRWPSTSLSALGRILFTSAAAARPGWSAGTRRSERRGRENAGPENEGPRLSDVSLEVFFYSVLNLSSHNCYS